ncbi:MAG: pyridoxal-dependent decarboxylase [Micavibrio sp.]|mgnify:CR=1 FL=1|nr:pyridoxal-dependent decarboxylase [Micavibrio sp.]
MIQAVKKTTQQNDTAPRLSLPPVINPQTQKFLDTEGQTVFDLVDAFGSPMNLIFPQVIDRNIKAFKQVYKKNNLSGQIYFTSKPNKSVSIMRQASINDVNIDVSSEGALKTVLGCGFRPNRIECTGPKNLEYLSLAVQQGVTINADNLTELKQAVEIKNSLGLSEKIKAFVRLSGFHSPRVKFTSQDGTFGMHVDEAPQIFEFLKAHESDIDFQGFAYYWSSASDEQRVVALENALELTFAAIEEGLNPKGINIGGGFHIQYANDRKEWSRYVDTVKQSLLGFGEELTWNNNGLGFRNEGGLIKGAANYVDHYMPHTSADDFDHVINLPLPSFDGMSAAQIISDSLLELYIEPGRALLDQLGVTVGRVNFSKKSVNGETMVALDMNRSNLHSTHQKLLTDPVILYKDKTRCRPCPEGVYYFGNLCVSYDIITYNKTFPELLPEPGDLVIFANTAPYIMDFIESNTLHQDTGQKVTVTEKDGRFRWFTDEKYKPVIQGYLKGESA